MLDQGVQREGSFRPDNGRREGNDDEMQGLSVLPLKLVLRGYLDGFLADVTGLHLDGASAQKEVLRLIEGATPRVDCRLGADARGKRLEE